MNAFLKTLGVAAFMLLCFGTAPASRAATTPELLITWRAHSYVPVGYQGKTLPSVGSTVDAALELIDGSTVVSLSNYEIRWYRGNDLFRKGFGLKRVSLTVTTTESDGAQLTAVVVGYKGQDRKGTIGIPVVDQEVVIDAPYPLKRVPAGIVRLRALPYFFNVEGLANLLFSWKANNLSAEGEKEAADTLELTLSSAKPGDRISVTTFVENPSRITEVENATLLLTVQ